MGGINHQPCNRPGPAYLTHSVAMSRYLSLAHSRLEAANVHLEDILLAEMGGHSGTTNHMITALDESISGLQRLRDQVKKLVEAMRGSNYVDLPTKHSFDLEKLGETLVQEGIVDKSAWEFVADLVGRGSFYDVFAYFDAEAKRLVALTEALRAGVTGLEQEVGRGEITLVLERNESGNIKVAFAQLYTAWNEFHRRFLASSMLSTELWYSFNRTGSLIAGVGVNAKAA